MTVEEILQRLKALGEPDNVAAMARYGIKTKKALGIAAPELRALAREIKKQAADVHAPALRLWASEIHEARIIAYLIDDPRLVTEAQMEAWVEDFDNWAICDGACGHLFRRTAFAYEKAFLWSQRAEEFVKRAGIVLMACLAVHDKKAGDQKIAQFLPALAGLAEDERNFVKKAVSWALRQIGKRNVSLNRAAVAAAERIREKENRAARWIAADALRELTSPKVRERLHRKAQK